MLRILVAFLLPASRSQRCQPGDIPLLFGADDGETFVNCIASNGKGKFLIGGKS